MGVVEENEKMICDRICLFVRWLEAGQTHVILEARQAKTAQNLISLIWGNCLAKLCVSLANGY